jgi:two-component system, OmpR family, alkaline phosphatase synthesis response regulator PhoP
MAINSKKVLLADDEADILEILSYVLEKEGYTLIKAKNGNEALELAKIHTPDLCILDIMMPYKTGLEVCEILRLNTQFNDTLIAFLTAINDDETHLKGLELGADDFIHKPISPKILASKVNAMFRRYKETSNTQHPKLVFGALSIDSNLYAVTHNGNAIVLAKKEFELLHLLASNTQKVFLRNEILKSIWGEEIIVGDRTIDVHVRKVRQKLGIDCIATIKGVGYKFVENF